MSEPVSPVFRLSCDYSRLLWLKGPWLFFFFFFCNAEWWRKSNETVKDIFKYKSPLKAALSKVFFFCFFCKRNHFIEDVWQSGWEMCVYVVTLCSYVWLAPLMHCWNIWKAPWRSSYTFNVEYFMLFPMHYVFGLLKQCIHPFSTTAPEPGCRRWADSGDHCNTANKNRTFWNYHTLINLKFKNLNDAGVIVQVQLFQECRNKCWAVLKTSYI